MDTFLDHTYVEFHDPVLLCLFEGVQRLGAVNVGHVYWKGYGMICGKGI